MKRRTFDALLSAGGFVLVVVLLVAGALLTWGSSFAASSVKSQLKAQRIYFPPKNSPELQNPQIAPYLDLCGRRAYHGSASESLR